MDPKRRVPSDDVEVGISMKHLGIDPESADRNEAVGELAWRLPCGPARAEDRRRGLVVHQSTETDERECGEPGTEGRLLPAGASSGHHLHEDDLRQGDGSSFLEQPNECAIDSALRRAEQLNPGGGVGNYQMS